MARSWTGLRRSGWRGGRGLRLLRGGTAPGRLMTGLKRFACLEVARPVVAVRMRRPLLRGRPLPLRAPLLGVPAFGGLLLWIRLLGSWLLGVPVLGGLLRWIRLLRAWPLADPVLRGPFLRPPVLGSRSSASPGLWGPLLRSPVLGSPLLWTWLLVDPAFGSPLRWIRLLRARLLADPVLRGLLLRPPVLGSRSSASPGLWGPLLRSPVLGSRSPTEPRLRGPLLRRRRRRGVGLSLRSWPPGGRPFPSRLLRGASGARRGSPPGDPASVVDVLGRTGR